MEGVQCRFLDVNRDSAKIKIHKNPSVTTTLGSIGRGLKEPK